MEGREEESIVNTICLVMQVSLSGNKSCNGAALSDTDTNVYFLYRCKFPLQKNPAFQSYSCV